jgi:hypothetical protein
MVNRHDAKTAKGLTAQQVNVFTDATGPREAREAQPLKSARIHLGGPGGSLQVLLAS